MAEELRRLKVILGIEGSDSDALLSEYLNMASNEIISWIYSSYPEIPEGAVLPAKYTETLIQAVASAYNIRGAEGEKSHSENGVQNVFKYEDLISYIRQHVYPYVYLGAES